MRAYLVTSLLLFGGLIAEQDTDLQWYRELLLQNEDPRQINDDLAWECKVSKKKPPTALEASAYQVGFALNFQF